MLTLLQDIKPDQVVKVDGEPLKVTRVEVDEGRIGNRFGTVARIFLEDETFVLGWAASDRLEV